ncbi:pilus (MSHA type) biogenesis protein MshL [Aurantivibrio infirmus]
MDMTKLGIEMFQMVPHSVCFLKRSLMSFLLLTLVSCSSQQHKSATISEVAIAEAMKQSQTGPVVPDAVNDVLLGTGTNTNNEQEPSEERFDISVNNIAAKVFFLSLVSGTNTNLVVHPEVDGVISLELNNVSVSEVLKVTREVFGYEYANNDGIYTIFPRKIRTEVFPIDYIDVQRKGSSDTSIIVGSISSNSGGNSSNGNYNDSGSQSGSGNQQVDNAGSRIQTNSDSDFWESLEVSLKAIVGSEKEDRLVMVNAQTGIVVVKAMPTELAAVRNFLEKSQISAVRQVILETKIIEVRLNDSFAAGIDWSTIQGQLSLGYNTSKLNPDIGSATRSGETAFSSVIGISDISKLLQLLETQGHVQVLSSPRVSTVNNQKAIIRVGSDEFFVTGISNSTTSNAAATTSAPSVDLASFFSGIALDVTPQIAENGEVILHVHPVISSVTDQQKEITVGSELFSLPLALRDIRESDSIVRAKDGQIIVLGGLMQETAEKNHGRRPFLASIPGLNALFKTKNENATRTELVILMRPVVVDGKAWEDDIRGVESRFSELGSEYRARF